MYARIDFRRAGTALTRQVIGPMPVEGGSKKEGSTSVQWNWDVDLYFGGEVINSNTREGDTLMISVHEENDLGT